MKSTHILSTMTVRSLFAVVGAALLVVQSHGLSVKSSADSRRAFLQQVSTATVAAATGLTSMPTASLAVTGERKVNAKLLGYGLPPVQNIPGLTPLCEIYGKGANRFPLLVTFQYPFDWVVVTPSNNANGEDGTIQAGEYAKGDTATLYVNQDMGNVKNVAEQDKEFFKNAVIKAISQKGDNVYQNFKVTGIEPTKGEYKGQDYVLVDFKYELLTGAGFEVDRVGTASVTSEGDAVEVLWTAVTRQRYKKMADTLRTIAKSFRCYADGINMSSELVDSSQYTKF